MGRIKYGREMTQTAACQFFEMVLPECNWPPGSNCCAFFHVSVQGFGPDITLTLSYDSSGH
jgi:hypothetical protein